MDELLNNVLIGIPKSTANLQLPDPELRDYFRDEQDRIYWVDTTIDDTTLDLVKFIFGYDRFTWRISRGFSFNYWGH